MHLVISSNLKPHSHTRVLARTTFDELCTMNEPADLIDLQDYAAAFQAEDESQQDLADIRSKIAAAPSVLLATPVYHFDVGATTKLLIELTGEAWRHKVVGLLATAAGRRSYMALTGLANSLMLEFRCLIMPYMVMTTPKSFEADQLVDQRASRRIGDLVESTCQWAAASVAIRESRQIRRSH